MRPDPQLTPEERARRDRVMRALANPAYFHAVYLAPNDPNWERDDAGRVGPVPQFAQDMLRFSVRNPRGVIELPPEFLKTTLLSQSLPLWLTYRHKYFGWQLRGLLMSEEEGMAVANLSVISWHILNNERLAEDFVLADGSPLVRPSETERTWKEDAIVVDREHVSRDPTWQAKGLDSKGVHGRRLDWFIGDDLVTPRNADSPTLRKRALDTFELQVETRLVAGAHALLCGNFNHTDDLLETIAKRPDWELFKRPSMHLAGQPDRAPKESQLADDIAVPTWPQAWPKERLLKSYAATPNRFRRIHLLDPRAEWGERLNVGWVTLIDPTETRLHEARFYIGIDPAGSDGTSRDLDFFNVTVCALQGGHLDVVQSLDVRTNLGRQVQLVGMLHDTFHRVGYGVTAIGASRQMLDAYFRAALLLTRRDLEHKLVPMSAPGHKEERLEGLGPYAQVGWLRVWRNVWENRTSDPVDRHEELTLMEQWRDFPNGNHDDKLDGLWMACRTTEEFALIGDREWSMEVADA